MTTKIFYILLFFLALWLMFDDFSGGRRVSRTAAVLASPIDFTWKDLIPSFKLPDLNPFN